MKQHEIDEGQIDFFNKDIENKSIVNENKAIRELFKDWIEKKSKFNVETQINGQRELYYGKKGKHEEQKYFTVTHKGKVIRFCSRPFFKDKQKGTPLYLSRDMNAKGNTLLITDIPIGKIINKQDGGHPSPDTEKQPTKNSSIKNQSKIEKRKTLDLLDNEYYIAGKISSQKHPPQKPIVIDRKKYSTVHADIQKKLQKQLEANNWEVIPEAESHRNCRIIIIDMVAKKGKEKNYYEVKPYEEAKDCIREALGQLLEYWDYGTSDNYPKAQKLFIVGPSALEETDKIFLKKRREKNNIPIYYLQIKP
jgi:hypothetical protein